jgi:cardiolipin synthase A/B
MTTTLAGPLPKAPAAGPRPLHDGRALGDSVYRMLSEPRVPLSSLTATYPWTEGNDLQPLVGGVPFREALIRDIDRAERFIHASVYGIHADAFGIPILDRLMARAKEGLEVSLSVDAWGTCLIFPWQQLPTRDAFKTLQESGVHLHVHTFDPIRSLCHPLLRDHRKIWVFDGRTAYLGGINIHRDWFDFHDLMLRAKGPVVHQLLANLFEVRKIANPDLRPTVRSADAFSAWYFPSLDLRGNDRSRILSNIPGQKSPPTEVLTAKLDSLERGDTFVASYPFVTFPKVIRGLEQAALRGAHAVLIVPGKSSKPVAAASLMGAYPSLLRSGVSVCEFPGMNHMKVAASLAGGQHWTLLGSLNWDHLSMLPHNHEVAIETDCPVVAPQLLQLLQEDAERARPVLSVAPRSVRKGRIAQALNYFL